jgi:hypothetical protein
MVRRTLLRDNIKNIGFNLEAQEKFVNDHSVIFEHYSAIPSPIGMKDRGDYRRPDSLDTFSSNGFIYKKADNFNAVLVSNQKGKQPVEGGLYDHSVARLILPRFYCDNKTPISLLPGDRVYIKDMDIVVANYQKVEYSINNVDYLQFPATSVLSLIDSQNIEYTCGSDFKVTDEGNIKWVQGGNNPGVDPDTGKGRVYGIRYNYKAFFYVDQLINEVRITNDGDSSEPSRMPMHVTIQREFVYHNRISNKENDSVVETPRKTEEPDVVIDENKYEVKVNLRNFE